MVDDILFVTSQQTQRRFAALNSQTTDIGNVEAAEKADIYSMDGRLVRRQATTTEGLKKGMYLVKGKTLVVQ